MAVAAAGAARRRVAVLVATVFVLLSTPASGQYLNAYKAGLDAIEARDWKLAASSMTTAIAERREEKMKLPVRLFLRPYVPHFYLGLARFESGDCAGALVAWAESERQGVLARLPEADQVRRGREECGRRDAEGELAQAREQARQALARAATAASALLERSKDEGVRELWSNGDPSPEVLHQRAAESLRQARGLLAGKGVDQRGIARAEALVHDAEVTLAEIEDDLGELAQAKRQELTAKGEGIDARVAEAQQILERTAYLAPYPRLVGKARADLEGLVAEAGRRDGASQAHLDGLASRLERSIESLAELTTAPPASLARAVEDYLGGRYPEVIAKLAPAKLGERRARAHARLLLAAARHALYLEGGELDEEMRSAAIEDARACREDDPRLEPAERFFSPRFVAFFAESVALPPRG